MSGNMQSVTKAWTAPALLGVALGMGLLLAFVARGFHGIFYVPFLMPIALGWALGLALRHVRLRGAMRFGVPVIAAAILGASYVTALIMWRCTVGSPPSWPNTSPVLRSRRRSARWRSCSVFYVKDRTNGLRRMFGFSVSAGASNASPPGVVGNVGCRLCPDARRDGR